MEFLASLATGVVRKIGELSVDKIVQHYQHLIHPNKSIDKLREEWEELSCMKQALLVQVNADRNKGHKIAPDVEYWLGKVEGTEADLQRLFQDDVPENNQWHRYSLSKGAAKREAEVLSLMESRGRLHIVSYPASPPRAGEIFTADIKAFESRTKVIMEVIEKLKNDELKRISICGMGGVGKTTLVKQVVRIVEADKLFDNVVFAVVSQNVDNWRIQGDIAGMLDLTLKKETLQGRASEILDRLKIINKVLVVLDDIWDELDFESIGLPSSIEYHKCCKILFTSRDEHVCDKMGSHKNFIVPTLSPDEAWDLFIEMAGSEICNQSDIYPIAKEIAAECGGLPIAIVTVGRALVNRRKHTWKDVHHQLKNSLVTSFTEMQNYVYSRIQLSYNYLDSEEHRDCLLLCCLFPEDFDIPIEALMRHGLGLGLFKGVGKLLTARNRVHDLVDNLKSRFLLLASEEEVCVKMHDVVREAVIWIASKGLHEYAMQGSVQIERFQQDTCVYKAMSLMFDESQPPVEFDNSNYQLLQLASRNKKSIPWPEDLSQGMSKLKVLSMQKLDIPKPPSVFKALHNLWTLRLESCDVGDISVIGRELTKLEILSLAYSNIKQLPPEIGQLGSLRLLDLTGCYDLYKIHSNVLARLSRLEELYIRVDNFSWQQNRTIMGELELLSHQLKVLEIRVEKFEILPKDLVFGNLETFWIYVGNKWPNYWRRGYLYSSILEITGVDCNFINNSMLMNQLVKNCEILRFRKVKHLKNMDSIHEIDESGLAGLNYLAVESCEDFEFLIAKKSTVNFSNLIGLTLERLPNLIGFAKAIVLDESHQSIQAEESRGSEIVEDEQHSFGAKLFTRDWLRQFPKLERLFLRDCSSLDMVFDLQEYSEMADQAVPLLFPQMKEMKIGGLSKLRHVWGNIPHNTQGFGNLTSLKIKECGSLRYVFTPSVVKALIQLEKVEIKCCQAIEEFISIGIEKDKAETVVFTKLDSLMLHNLPSLVSLCSNFDVELAWPSLRHLEIGKCQQLNPSQIQKVIESAEQDNVGIPSDIGCSTTTSKKGSTRFLNCCFGYANKSNIEVSSPNVVGVHNCNPVDANKLSIFKFMDGLLFPNLTFLRICFCDKVSCLFSSSSSTSLKCLRVLDIVCCNNIEEIVFGGKEARTGEIVFPGLQILKLQYLANFRCFCLGSHHLEFPLLKEVSIFNCPKIEGLSIKEAQTGEIVFPRLQILKLDRLANFKYFCLGSHHLEFPLLEKVYIIDCPKIEGLSCQSSKNPKLQDIYFYGRHYKIKYMHKEDLNAIIQQFKALNVLQTSEVISWGNLAQGIMNCSIENHENLSRVVSFNEISIFQFLKKLIVNHCTSLVEVFESEEVLNLDVKKKDYELEVMELTNLPKLMHIWKSLISRVVNFRNLRELRVSGCRELTSVLPLSLAQNLVQLQYLSVQKCNMIEDIVIQKDGESEGASNKVKMLFPELKGLYLRHLPKLKCFCSAAYDFELPSCDTMEIQKCPNLTTFSCGAVSTPKLSQILLPAEKYRGRTTPTAYTMGDLNSTIHYIYNASVFEERMQKSETFGWIEDNKHLFGNITRVTELNLKNYQSLLNYVPSNMMRRFQHLTILNVEECDSIVEIFESEGVYANNEEHVIMPDQLRKMCLHSLPKPASIWKSHHTSILGFQNLRELEVKSCNSLKSVFPLSIAKSLPNLRGLKVSNCQMMEEIVAFKIDVGDKISQEPNETKFMVFPCLEELVLEDLPSLKHFCAGPCDFELPWCRYLTIKNCRKMKSFCHGITFTPGLKYLFVEKARYSYPKEGLDAIIQRHYHWEEQMQKLQTFRWIEHDELLLEYITRVKGLNLRGYKNLLNCVPSNIMHIIQHLTSLNVEECDSVVEIFESKGVGADNEEHGFIPYQLRWMCLHSLPKLASIWKSHHASILSFQNLRTLEVESCHSLKSVFPISIAKSLPNLQRLKVSNCQMMEEIVAFKTDEGDKISQEPNETEVMAFPWLEELDLTDLPSLKCFCAGPCIILSFQNLSSLKVNSCHNLKSVFPLSIAKSLPNLRRLEVSNCQMMEEIVAFKTDEGDEISQEPNETEVMAFPWLYTLDLTDLASLKCFCAGPCNLELSNCEEIIIKNCKKMESFCHGSTLTPKLKSLSVEDTEYSYPEEGLDAIIQCHYQSQNAAEAEKQFSPAI